MINYQCICTTDNGKSSFSAELKRVLFCKSTLIARKCITGILNEGRELCIWMEEARRMHNLQFPYKKKVVQKSTDKMSFAQLPGDSNDEPSYSLN